VSGMNQFAREMGILSRAVAYDRVVATGLSHLWRS